MAVLSSISSTIPTWSPSLQSLPLEYLLPLPLLLAQITLYAIASPRLATEKQRAYILSVTFSALMTVMSIPFVLSYATYGLEATFEMAQSGWMGWLAKVGVVGFGTYLFADLAVGYIMYPAQIGMLTGWIHHTVYIGLMIHLVQTRLSPVFCIGAIMELPTFDLGISTLMPSLRSDERFLSTFLIFRILYHLVLLLDTARPSVRATMDGSFVPLCTLSLALVLHVSWFQAGVAGYLRRRAKKRTSSTLSSAEGAKMEDDYDINLHLPPLPQLEPSHGSSLSPPSSPSESPLITPHTPAVIIKQSSGAITPRSGFLHLPAMPSMLNLPALALPLPLHQLHLPNVGEMHGFKDAVKSRWEEQKGRFGLGKGMRVRKRLHVEEGEGEVGESEALARGGQAWRRDRKSDVVMRRKITRTGGEDNDVRVRVQGVDEDE